MTQPATATQHDVSVKDAAPTTVLATRRTVAMEQLGATIGGTFGELYGYIGGVGVQPAGPPFVIYHARLEDGARWDVELCAPVPQRVEPPPGFECRVLSGGRVATTLHHGPYEGLAAAYDAIARWVEEQGLALGGPPRETYLSEPGTPPEEIRTLIEWPLAEPVG